MTQTQHQTHPLTRTDLIRALDQEVDRLLQARHLLAETLPPGQEIFVPLRRQKPQLVPPLPSYPSAALREIDQDIEPAKKSASSSSARPRRKLSAAARRRISEAQTARWKKFHQAQRTEKKSQVA